MGKHKKIIKRLKDLKKDSPPTPSTGGRAKKIVDWPHAIELTRAGCPGTEVASYFDMDCDTFYLKVKAEFKMSYSEFQFRCREVGKSILRYTQYKKAIEKEDNSLLIWLGKQRLNQSDDPKTQDSFPGTLAEGLAKLRAIPLPESKLDLTLPSLEKLEEKDSEC